jgi:hypothetical protein
MLTTVPSLCKRQSNSVCIQRYECLNAPDALQIGKTLKLKCPCGETILPPTPVIPNLSEPRRGMLKSRIRNHLRIKHELSELAVRSIISESFASN